MATRPATWSDEEWEQHVAEARAETSRRAAVSDHTDAILDLQARVAALEGKRPEPEAPAATPPAAPKAKKQRR